MAKRAAKLPSPAELMERLDETVDAMVGIAGAVPQHPIKISPINADGEDAEQTVTGRTALLHFVTQAAQRYYFDKVKNSEPTPRQLSSDFNGIEIAARRLLTALKVGPRGDLEAMPSGLRFGGLQAFAAREAEAGLVARVGYAGNFSAGSSLLRNAVRGVEQLARWSGAARKRSGQRVGAKASTKRYKGDGGALDAFVARMISNCWCIVYRRDVAEGSTLYRFIQAATTGVGARITEDAARERLRRLMGRRGKLTQT